MNLKPSTVLRILTVLNDLGRSTGYEFALSYYSDKYSLGDGKGVIASKLGRNLLYKVAKAGLITVYQRTGSSGEVKVFDLSDSGLEYIKKVT